MRLFQAKLMCLSLSYSLIVLLVCGGCQSPRLYDQAREHKEHELKLKGTNKEDLLKEVAKGIQVTDQDVLALANSVLHMFDKRWSWARIAREISATVQVLSAAAAATLGVAATGNAQLITALAGTSTVIPQLQSVFGAKEQAVAYNQGAALIREAEKRFFIRVASTNGRINSDRLTPDGAELYGEVLGSLNLVMKALTAQIPSIEDIEKATGKNPPRLKASDLEVSLRTGETGQIAIVEGGPVVNYAWQPIGVAHISSPGDSFPKRIEISVEQAPVTNSANLRLFNEKGEAVVVRVRVP